MDDIVVGTDLVLVREVANSIGLFGARYVRRLFTDGESRYCERFAGSAAEHYAARFAAKEAVVKVLGLDGDPIAFRSIEVERAPSGACRVMLHGDARAAATRAGIRSLALSMSHEAEYAIAVVVARVERPARGARSALRRPSTPRRHPGLRPPKKPQRSERR